ncbi:hypothetical protein MA5S0421_2295 [Mycobacteroides abscessus 5S-0421]|nr:hypothetical protein MA5S0421_2295 [Mycobacteroides abscessus 5S-0421]
MSRKTALLAKVELSPAATKLGTKGGVIHGCDVLGAHVIRTAAVAVDSDVAAWGDGRGSSSVGFVSMGENLEIDVDVHCSSTP